MRLVVITEWMVSRVPVEPVVWGKNYHKLEMEVQVGSLVNVTVQVQATMEEWVQVGLVKVVPDKAPNMGKEADHVLKAGSEVKQGV